MPGVPGEEKSNLEKQGGPIRENPESIVHSILRRGEDTSGKPQLPARSPIHKKTAKNRGRVKVPLMKWKQDILPERNWGAREMGE